MSNSIVNDYVDILSSLAEIEEIAERQVSALAEVTQAFEAVKDAILRVSEEGRESAAVGSIIALSFKDAAESLLLAADFAKRLGYFPKDQPEALAKISNLTSGFINLGIAVGSIAFEAITKHFSDFLEKQKDLKAATQDLQPLLGYVGSGFSNSGKEASNAVGSLGNYIRSIDELIKRHALLATATVEKIYNTEIDLAVLERHKKTIIDFMDESKSAEISQGQLQVAIAGVNQACGTNIQILDFERRVLSESVDSIESSTEAWKRNAWERAAQEKLVEYYAQLIENEIALEKARQDLETAKENDPLHSRYGGYGIAVEQARQKLEKLTESNIALNEQIDGLTNMVAENTEVMTSSREGISEYIAKNKSWQEALSENNISISDFSKGLSELGISTSVIAGQSEESMAAFAESFDKGISGVTANCEKLGPLMATEFERLFNSIGKDAALGFAGGLDPALVEEMAMHLGDDALKALAKSLDARSPSRKAMELGLSTAEGFSKGIVDDESAEMSAKMLALKARGAIEGEVSSEKMAKIAACAAEGFSEGLSADETMQLQAQLNAMNARMAIEAEVAQEKISLIGKGAAEGLAKGIKDDQSAKAAAQIHALNARIAMEAEVAPSKTGLIGKDAASGFAAGIGEGEELSKAKGMLIAEKTREALRSENNNAKSWGTDLISGLASGISSAAQLVTNAVSNVAGIIKSFLHFSRPDEGPLRDYESWMPDMISGLALSMRKAAPVIYAEAKAVADGIAENINDWEISSKDLHDNTTLNLATTRSAQASLHDLGTTNNYYTIGDVSYVPDSRVEELVMALFGEIRRVKRLGVYA
ncbi:MAG: hypothetical protein FWE48_03450 [Coriobacteriia bacterium]|nr:hypothetical protein [Coriobacteriia bacterium]